MSLDIEQIPGHAQPIWGGYVWMTEGGVEHRWSKRPTRVQCEAIVREVCERDGIAQALELDESEVES